jgi:hypothetical protein
VEYWSDSTGQGPVEYWSDSTGQGKLKLIRVLEVETLKTEPQHFSVSAFFP